MAHKKGRINVLAHETNKIRPFLARHVVVPPRVSVAHELFLNEGDTQFYIKYITRCFNIFFICTTLVRHV